VQYHQRLRKRRYGEKREIEKLYFGVVFKNHDKISRANIYFDGLRKEDG